MKNIHHIFLSIGLSFSMLFTTGCSKNEGLIKAYEQFIPNPKTAVATKVVNNSDLIARITTDTTYKLIDGLEATEIRYLSTTGLSIKAFVFEIDLTSPSIRIEVSTPNNSPSFGMQPMTKQAIYEDFEGHKVWAGINADFYNMDTGVPQGIVYKEGLAIKTTVTDAVNTFFAITKDGKAVIGDQQMYPDIKNIIQEAVGGRVTLLKDGVAVQQVDKRLEPRTCIGVNQDGTKVYMLVVDGRNFHYSNGMNYDDLAKFMKALGAYQAINLDGGGSSTFFIRTTPSFGAGRFAVRNWPTDNGGKERSVANGLIVVSVTN
ncbi:phosphodiester glycosidase family protein [Haoranjiania flava]|uniref:Phosphodiester glycosidase family protein n=1 Tax=Haoranjiania flava TaxID=1856322 RepID=A0AAE3ILN0_9BACT|nr:phosphodiester glycosidase family protein [Haoranjiania flava]MCU7694435.1 phosphodiester glycosidase family protein [Haoranjiania flava]